MKMFHKLSTIFSATKLKSNDIARKHFFFILLIAIPCPSKYKLNPPPCNPPPSLWHQGNYRGIVKVLH